jgi:hypothetical protein
MKCKIFLIIVLFCFFWASNTQAIKRAIFPDPQSLQPAPIEVKYKVPRNDLLEAQKNNMDEAYNEMTVQDKNIQLANDNATGTKKEAALNVVYWIFGSLVIFSFFVILIIKKYVKFN